MLDESTLNSYLSQTEGWTVGRSRTPYAFRKQGVKTEIPFKAAHNDEKGVHLRWFACTDDSRKKDFQAHREGVCPNHPHIHLEIRVRTKAGGLTSFNRHNQLTVPPDMTSITGARGAPKTRKKITKGAMPEPFNFCQEKWNRTGPTGWERMTMIARCGLVGPVGISDNAKVLADMAQHPDEEVWFHFDCTGPLGATYDIITDGEVFYPINRRSKRITTNLKPKSSVDLTQLSIVDQEMLVHAIQVYAGEVVDG